MSTSKTPKQINEFADFIPIGTIFEVPKEFSSPAFLDLNGQKVLKTDYPKLASAVAKTFMDQGDYLVLESPPVERVFSAGNNISFKMGLSDKNKLVVKVK